MRPILIGVGGAHSGCGKTEAASAILGRLRGWGAIKCTPSALYSSVVDALEVQSGGDKDTDRLLRAGAEEVLWVQAMPEDLEETMEIAVGRLSHLPGIVVEGNSAIEVLKPDIVIFISGEPDRMKGSAGKILEMADLVIYRAEPPAETPGKARVFHQDDRTGYVNCVSGVIDGRRSEGAA